MYVEQRQVLNGWIHAAKLNEITISIQQVSILAVAQGILGSLVIRPSQKKQQQQGKVSACRVPAVYGGRYHALDGVYTVDWRVAAQTSCLHYNPEIAKGLLCGKGICTDIMSSGPWNGEIIAGWVVPTLNDKCPCKWAWGRGRRDSQVNAKLRMEYGFTKYSCQETTIEKQEKNQILPKDSTCGQPPLMPGFTESDADFGLLASWTGDGETMFLFFLSHCFWNNLL